MATVLVVEDDAALLEILTFNLKREGYNVIEAVSASEALIMLEESKPDLIILDLMLPGLKGEEFLRIIRERKEEMPVIVVSAKDSENTIVNVLKEGADDYLTKPVSIRILLAKVENVLKKRLGNQEKISYRNLEIYPRQHRVTVNNEDVTLTHTEFELLSLLVKHPGMVFTRSQLLNSIWGYESYAQTRTVDAHVSSLRKKLKRADLAIKSVPRVGYKLE